MRALRLSKKVIVGVLILAASAFASDKPKKGATCDELLGGGVTVGENQLYPSGRDADVFPKYVEAADVIFGENGIAQRLGYSIAPHQMTFAPSFELSALAVVGWHPTPHFIDGGKIVHGMKSVRGVLEFVQPGCPTCRSFFRDTTEVRHQYAIMAHVAGHNDFSYHSMFARARGADPVASSLELARLVDKYYATVDRDSVVQWVQYLYSLSSIQDYALGTYDSVESFLQEKKKAAGDFGRVVHVDSDPLAKYLDKSSAYSKQKPKVIPAVESASVFQAILANLPDTAPKWKKEITEAFEKTSRAIPFVVQTKIMNEGWATFTQILMMAHSPWTNSRDSIDFARLLTGVTVPRLSNPYWLGLEAWIRLYTKFNKAHPELEKLPMIERDRKFVEYAHKLIDHMSDDEFLYEALDDQWIMEKRLSLYRTAEHPEWDPTLPRDPNPENNYQYVITSKDPARVRDYLIRMIADKTGYFPQIVVSNFNAFGRNVFSLKHRVKDGVPLERFSAAQTMFVLSQTIERPVSLETIGSSEWLPKPEPGPTRFGPWWEPPPPPQPPTSFPIRIEVEPNGKVIVVNKTENGEELNYQLSMELNAAVQVYREDTNASFNEDLIQHWSERYAQTKVGTLNVNVSKAVDQIVDPSMALVTRAGTVAQAVEEYARLLRMRLMSALRAAIKGKRDMKRTATGMRVKVMPDQPEFRLDRKVQQVIRDRIPPAPVDDPLLGRPKAAGELVDYSKFDSAAAQAKALNLTVETLDLKQYASVTSGNTGKSLINRIAVALQRDPRTIFKVVGVEDATDGAHEVMNALVHKRTLELQEPNGNVRVVDARFATFWVKKGSAETLLLRPEQKNTSNLMMKDDGSDIGSGRGKPGRKFWGPNPNGNGQGNGEPGSGEPGKDGMDPSEVEIDMEFYGRLLAEELELPNIRRTNNGKSERVTWQQEDAIRKMDGNPLWHRMMPDAIARAIVARKKKGLPWKGINPRLLGKEGIKLLTEQDKIVPSKEPVKLPDFKAVMVFAIDMSGSMYGDRQEVAKEIVFNAKALLRAYYKDVEFRFVGFDTRGHEFTEEEIFNRFLGGGTRYSGGLEKAQEILNEYNVEEWNKYLITLGDGETGQADANDSIAILDELYPELQYSGFGYLTVSPWGGGGWVGPFSQAIEAYSNTKEWFGFAEVKEKSREAVFGALKAFFGKKNAKNDNQ